MKISTKYFCPEFKDPLDECNTPHFYVYKSNNYKPSSIQWKPSNELKNTIKNLPSSFSYLVELHLGPSTNIVIIKPNVPVLGSVSNEKEKEVVQIESLPLKGLFKTFTEKTFFSWNSDQQKVEIWIDENICVMFQPNICKK